MPTYIGLTRYTQQGITRSYVPASETFRAFTETEYRSLLTSLP